MVLTFATSDSNPFANSPAMPYKTSSRMWPLCLQGTSARGEFSAVSAEAHAIGIVPGTRYILEFAPNADLYAFTFETPSGNRHAFGAYTWSLAQTARDSLSEGANTRQSQLDLGTVWSGPVFGMCLAEDTNSGTFTSQLGVASFNVSAT